VVSVAKTTEGARILREVGPNNPPLQKRALLNPVTAWSMTYCMGNDRHPHCEMHLDIADALIHDKRACFIAPRSFAKTTRLEEYILFQICEAKNIAAGLYPGVYPHRRIRFLSWAGGKAEETIAHVREQLEYNDDILRDYGFMGQGSDTWGKTSLVTRDGLVISAAGRGAQVRGFRPTLLICDDLDDDEEVESDERLTKAFKWWDTAVYGTIDEDDYQVFVIGTVLADTSMLTYIADKPGWTTRRYAAYVDDIEAEGHEAWPSKWPHAKLKQRQLEIGRRNFLQEYMNQPQPSGNAIFERDWFKRYSPNDAHFRSLVEGGYFYTVETCDPAISKRDGADYTAIVVMSATFDEVPKVYLRTEGVIRGHWSLMGTVLRLARLWERFFCSVVGIETVAYQEALAEEMERYCEMNRLNIKVDRLQPDGDKERRAHAVASMVERGCVHYDPNDPLHLRLIEECVLFVPGRVNIKKDLMDAFVYGLGIVRTWAKRGTRQQKAVKVLPKGATHSKTTGVVR
jgi:hypothetical protein